MLPTIKPGQIILVNRFGYLFKKPKINDIIVFKKINSTLYFVKRIVSIQDRKYFVRGDNKNDSTDSRDFGWISKKHIIGKVLFVR